MTFSRIVIAVPSARFLRWHERLRASLARLCGQTETVFRFEPGEDAQPLAVTQLLTLERILLRRNRPTLCDLIPCPPAHGTLDADADIVIDLVGNVVPSGRLRVLRPLYDGQESDQAAISAILAGAVPTIAVEDAATGVILAHGLPSFEAADGLTGGLEAVYSRMAVLIAKAITTPESLPDRIKRGAQNAPRRPAAFFARNAAFHCVRRIYHLCCHSPHWRIGWRFVDGPGAIETGVSVGPAWRTIPDHATRFGADPFPVQWQGQSGVFYESFDYRRNIGEIHFQRFDSTGPVGAPVCALREDWHLSYPFLIEEDGALYMVPEASSADVVMLYRCVAFPDRWEPVATLVEGVEAADATIFRHGGRYWMTSVIREGVGGYSDTLAIHRAERLFGPWSPHPKSPALVDARFARPAGAVVVAQDGALLRPVQDCANGYGKRIAVMRIDRLDDEAFSQTFLRFLAPGDRWPGQRLHTVNRAGRLECIDGAVLTPKFMPLRRLTHAAFDRRLSA